MSYRNLPLVRLYNREFHRKILITCAALFAFSQILFLLFIQFPQKVNFDEFHYVPSAKQFLALVPNQNWEHPPLAKEIMAVGIGILGDRPVGWRIMSTLFGSATLVGMYLWGLAIFESPEAALWVALVTLADQMLYVQARIGMLDTFMGAFIVWAMAAFCAAWTWGQGESRGGWSDQQLRILFRFCGVCLGLATACKWFGVIPWALCLILVGLIRVFQNWGVRFERPLDSDWYRPTLWAAIGPGEWALSFLALPLLVYYLTFIPFFFIHGNHTTIGDVLFGMQLRMWQGQGRVVSSHPYMSTWPQWALIRRPIWYAFDKEGRFPREWVRGVILLGNPFVIWSGVAAVAFCFFSWIRSRRREAFLILVIYAAFYLSWIVIPRKIAFYYYYYPAALVLSLALGYLFERLEKAAWASREAIWARWIYLGIAIGVFIYFFPISAALRIPANSFRRWMWFSSWI